MDITDALAPWARQLHEQVPGIELFDAHTHVGENDPDGFHQTTPELIERLRGEGIRGCFVFPFHEPDGYPEHNDTVITEALATRADPGGPQLVPFCRVDPHHDPLAEAERCLAIGARGIKLHPRAERFDLDHPAVRGLFALAHERALPVIVHAGRGIAAGGRHLARLCEEFPNARAILAHAGVTDLSWIWRVAADLPNLLFDTSWFMPADLKALLALVPPGQILFASDAPYGDPLGSAIVQFRLAQQLGMSDDHARLIASGQAGRIARGEPLAVAGPAIGERETPPHLLLDRVADYLLLGVVLGFRGSADAGAEMIALARQACAVPDSIDDAPAFHAIMRLIDASAALEVAAPGDRRTRTPLFVALAVAHSPDVALPPV